MERSCRGAALAAMVVALAVGSLAGAVQAQLGATPERSWEYEAGEMVNGYTFINAMNPYYYNNTLDLQDVHALLDRTSPNWAAIQDIYVKGKHAERNGTKRSALSFARSNYTNETYYRAASTYHGSPFWLDSLLGAAVNGSGLYRSACCGVRSETIRALLYGWPLGLMFHETDAARNKIRQANQEAAIIESEEGVAVWWGAPSARPQSTLYGLAQQLARQFCQLNSSVALAPVNARFINSRNALHVAAVEMDDKAHASAYTGTQQAAVTLALQAVVRAVRTAASPPANATACVAQCAPKAHQAAAKAWWDLVAPIVAGRSPAEALAVAKLLAQAAPAPTASTLAQLEAALAAAARAVGLTWAKDVDACAAPAPATVRAAANSGSGSVSSPASAQIAAGAATLNPNPNPSPIPSPSPSPRAAPLTRQATASTLPATAPATAAYGPAPHSYGAVDVAGPSADLG